MNMKRILALFAVLVLAIPGVQAQNWLDALKKGATTAVDKATGGKLTEMALYGTWTYSQPSVKFEGEGLAAAFGGSVVETLIVDQLTKIYAKGGLEAGKGTLTFVKKDKKGAPTSSTPRATTSPSAWPTASSRWAPCRATPT